MPSQWSSAKAKVQLRLAVQRLRTLQQKKEAQAKASRRDIASLLERGKIETARIKVETIIHEDVHIELLELLELYSELLLARFGLLDQNTREPDPGIAEGVCSIIHAAPRTELKELHVLRDILMHKYGREFSLAVMENRDGCVSERVTRKLITSTPPAELVDAYLYEIAKGYSVDWSPPLPAYDENAEGAAAAAALETEAVAGAEGASTSTSTEGAKDDNPKPTEKDPKATDDTAEGDSEKPKPKDGNGASAARPSSSRSSPSPAPKPAPPEEDDFDALAKRFAALKKR